MTGGRSPACAYARPNERHVCSGCDCTCHHIPAPGNFRDIVARWRERAQEQRQENDE